MKPAFVARRRRRCEYGDSCTLGGRVLPGHRAVRVRQHSYVHQADLDASQKAITVMMTFDIEPLRALLEGFAAFAVSMGAMWRDVFREAAFLDGAPRVPHPLSRDSQSFDPDPDRCWRCDAKPGMDELDGCCWHCHYDLTGRKPQAPEPVTPEPASRPLGLWGNVFAGASLWDALDTHALGWLPEMPSR